MRLEGRSVDILDKFLSMVVTAVGFIGGTSVLLLTFGGFIMSLRFVYRMLTE